MNQALVHFHEIKLKKSDLNALSEEEMAILGMLSYICNELNVFARLLRLSERQEDRSGPIKFASDLQYHVILRTLSSRLFEAHQFLDEVSNKVGNLRPDFSKIIRESAEGIEKLRDSEGHAINRSIRNETGFHYKFKTALKNVRSLSDDADASIYVSDMDGNSYFSLGESVVFFERLRRFSDADKKYENPESLAEVWLFWCLEVVRLVKKLQADLFGLVLDTTDSVSRKTHYFVNPDIVAEGGRDVVPIFLRSTT